MQKESMAVLQVSANTEINRFKEEIAMLKEKKAADEQNQRNLEAYKILRQERDSMEETLQQAVASIFAPIGLTKSPPPAKECMVLAGNFVSTAVKQAKEIAKLLNINIKAVDPVMKYSEILRQAPLRIVSWKPSCTQAGARMSLAMSRRTMKMPTSTRYPQVSPM